jgi:acetyl-CoA acetyltransferase
MSGVSVVGVGMIPFGKYPDKNIVDLGWPAVKAAIKDANIDPKKIEAVYSGTSRGGAMMGQRIMGRLGLAGLPIINVENACSSSSSAMAQAVIAVASGAYDIVLVIGVEKLSKYGGGTLPLDEDDWEVRLGLNMPALYAMRAQRYMHDYGVSAAQLAGVSVKNRKHGALNPDAQMRKPVSVEEVLGSRMVADPFTLLQCCPTGDGSAAIILASNKVSWRIRGDAIDVVASHLTSGTFMTGFRDMTSPEITVRGAKHAFEEAGLGPKDVRVAEVHDAFSIAELLYYEAFGFCPRGEGAAMLESGATTLGGRIPINPSGGLLAKGHPVGATGAAQIVEIARQLWGQAGPRQVEGAKVGLTHATGGGISGFDHGACSIHIFQR